MSALPHVIFDLDDTLLESFDSYVRLHQRIARDLGWPVPDRRTLVAYGPTWPATVARLWPGRDLAPFFHRYEQTAHVEVYRSFAGVPDTLRALRDQGYPLWIVSKRSRLRMDMRLEQAGIDPTWFRGIFADEDQPASKPDPRCFAPVWDATEGRRPALYVGDRHDDRVAAQRAGLPFVAVRTGPEATLGTFPDDHPEAHTLDCAAELGAWLERHAEAIVAAHHGEATR